ncbi:cupin [Alteripontixanthobacter maritimus]|uniref:cupin n=1 Tax=Alteripontixanthobacter maritimus TaxID=2161824 RepID=UPI001E5F08E4|nr:cupin [Alteripontixanthobacter maritimus]
MTPSAALKLADNFVHLGLGASAVSQPPFTGLDWYEGYGARHGGDGAEGRLVSQYEFTTNWDVWEMHPVGAEVVICTAGAMTLLQEMPDGETVTTPLVTGEYAINPPAVWHTADVPERATAIFITAGEGTEHRPR